MNSLENMKKSISPPTCKRNIANKGADNNDSRRANEDNALSEQDLLAIIEQRAIANEGCATHDEAKSANLPPYTEGNMITPPRPLFPAVSRVLRVDEEMQLPLGGRFDNEDNEADIPEVQIGAVCYDNDDEPSVESQAVVRCDSRVSPPHQTSTSEISSTDSSSSDDDGSIVRSETVLVATMIVDSSGTRPRRRWKLHAALCLMIAVAVAGTVAFFTIGKGGETPSAASGPPARESSANLAFRQQMLARLRVFLVGVLPDNSGLYERNSVQSLTLDWLVLEDQYEGNWWQNPQGAAQQHDPKLMRSFVQRFVLVAVAFSCGGEEWDGLTPWTTLAHLHECDWEGIVCDGDVVTGIELIDVEMVGMIPVELGILTDLGEEHYRLAPRLLGIILV